MIKKFAISALCTMTLTIASAFGMDARAGTVPPVATFQDLLVDVDTLAANVAGMLGPVATDGQPDLDGIHRPGGVGPEYRWLMPDAGSAHRRDLGADLDLAFPTPYTPYLGDVKNAVVGAPVIQLILDADPLNPGNNNFLPVTPASILPGGYFEGFSAPVQAQGVYARRYHVDIPDPNVVNIANPAAPAINGIWYFLIDPRTGPLPVAGNPKPGLGARPVQPAEASRWDKDYVRVLAGPLVAKAAQRGWTVWQKKDPQTGADIGQPVIDYNGL